MNTGPVTEARPKDLGTGCIPNRQIQRWKIDWWFPGAVGKGDGKQLLNAHKFSSGLERMSCSSVEMGAAHWACARCH